MHLSYQWKCQQANTKVCGLETPGAVGEVFLTSGNAMIWCIIHRTRISGTYFFPNRSISCEINKNMLRSSDIPRLIDFNRSLIFKPNEAPPHRAANCNSICTWVFCSVGFGGEVTRRGWQWHHTWHLYISICVVMWKFMGFLFSYNLHIKGKKGLNQQFQLEILKVLKHYDIYQLQN